MAPPPDEFVRSGFSLSYSITQQVLCWIPTNDENYHKRARHAQATWGKRCDTLLMIGSFRKKSSFTVALNVSEGRDHLWLKTKAAIRYIYKHHLLNHDWFLKADDDTYIIMENLKRFLQKHEPQHPLYLGHRFARFMEQGYLSGGAGYVLSQSALRTLVEEGFRSDTICLDSIGLAEDIELGHCAELTGVRILDTLDDGGKETFHVFPPEVILMRNSLGSEEWYWKYDKHGREMGPDSASQYSISFHYVEPDHMYAIDYFIHKLKLHSDSMKDESIHPGINSRRKEA